MCSSIAEKKESSRRKFPLLCSTLIIAFVIACSLFSWFIFQNPYAPLRQYPNAQNIQTQYTDEDNCCTKTITTFETTDSPDEVYKFYKKEFRFRFKWLSMKKTSGLSYSSFWGCPVGSYSITAVQKSGKTEVTIRLSTHLCI